MPFKLLKKSQSKVWCFLSMQRKHSTALNGPFYFIRWVNIVQVRIFFKWVTIIYNKPQAAILTIGFRSEYFTTMHRGVMQGCPLFAPLFALAIRPLAKAIRATPTILGFQIGQLCHKITLYADDILIPLTEPETSVPALIDVINRFSCFSGYKVN